MWLVLNDSFVSVVEHYSDPKMLVVRGRFPGDVARFLGLEERWEEITPERDYRYRMVVSRADVAAAMSLAAKRINYPNFKGSIREGWRASLAGRVWSLFYQAQQDRHPD